MVVEGGYQLSLSGKLFSDSWVRDAWVIFQKIFFSACLTQVKSATGSCGTMCPACRCVRLVSNLLLMLYIYILCTFANTYTCMHAHTCTQCTHTCTHSDVHACIHSCTHRCTSVWDSDIDKCVCVFFVCFFFLGGGGEKERERLCMCVCVYIITCMHVCVCVDMYVCEWLCVCVFVV